MRLMSLTAHTLLTTIIHSHHPSSQNFHIQLASSQFSVQELQKNYVTTVRERMMKTLQRLETIKWQLGAGSQTALGAEEVAVAD